MITFLSNLFSKFSNIIIYILLILIITIGSYCIYLKYENKSKDKIIAEDKVNLNILKENVLTLQNGINTQNKAIEEMNKAQTQATADFNKRYEDLQDKQKTIIKKIEKQKSYVSPKNVSECDAVGLVIDDFVKNRDSK